MRFALILFAGFLLITFAPVAPIFIIAGLVLLVIFADDAALDNVD